jgi:hypothetical protein
VLRSAPREPPYTPHQARGTPYVMRTASSYRSCAPRLPDEMVRVSRLTPHASRSAPLASRRAPRALRHTSTTLHIAPSVRPSAPWVAKKVGRLQPKAPPAPRSLPGGSGRIPHAMADARIDRVGSSGGRGQARAGRRVARIALESADLPTKTSSPRMARTSLRAPVDKEAS